MDASSPDPVCPTCGGKVSARAEFCMHCGDEFDRPADGNDRDGDRRGRSRGAVSEEADGGGESLLSRVRPGPDGPGDTETPSTDRRDDRRDDRRTRTRSHSRSRSGSGDAAGTSGRANGGVAARTDGVTARTGRLVRAAREDPFTYGGAAVVVGLLAMALGGYGLSVSAVGTGVALVAWAAFSATLVRRRSVFEAFPKVVVGAVVSLLFVPLVVASALGETVSGPLTAAGPPGPLTTALHAMVVVLYVAWAVRSS